MKTIHNAAETRRPFYMTNGDGADSNTYPIRDLEQWESIAVVPGGCVCQVIWRERHHHEYRIKNVQTRVAAAQFVRSQINDLGAKLYDIGITPEQSIKHTEFAGKGSL